MYGERLPGMATWEFLLIRDILMNVRIFLRDTVTMFNVILEISKTYVETDFRMVRDPVWEIWGEVKL